MMRSFIIKVAKELSKADSSKLKGYAPYAAGAVSVPALAYLGARISPGASAAASSLRKSLARSLKAHEAEVLGNLFRKIIRK